MNSLLQKRFVVTGIDSEKCLKELDNLINEFGSKFEIVFCNNEYIFNPNLNTIHWTSTVFFKLPPSEEERFDSIPFGVCWNKVPDPKFKSYGIKKKSDGEFMNIKAEDLQKDGDNLATEWDIEDKRFVFVKNPSFVEGDKKPYWNVFRQVK
jgi:hypothetical protein